MAKKSLNLNLPRKKQIAHKYYKTTFSSFTLTVFVHKSKKKVAPLLDNSNAILLGVRRGARVRGALCGRRPYTGRCARAAKAVPPSLKGAKTEWVQVWANSISFAIYALK